MCADNLKYIFAPIPNFWAFITLKELITTGTNDYLHLGIGFVYTIVLIAVLFYIFNKKN
jgi:hypothetical protein